MTYHEIACSSASDDWATPQATFDQLAREFGPFDLDVCASPDNAKCDRYFTTADNGLSRRWQGRCWMNPPYGRTIGHWMTKARQEAATGALVVCLVPARVDTRWWLDSKSAASLIRFLPGRLRFGTGKYPPPFPSAVVVFGQLRGRHGTDSRPCVCCQTPFFPARRDAKTCSPKCRQAHRRSRITAPKCDAQ